MDEFSSQPPISGSQPPTTGSQSSVFGRQSSGFLSQTPFVGSQTPVSGSGRTLFGSAESYAFYSKPRPCWVIGVEGFDTSLPEGEIKEALINHFKSCGIFMKVFLYNHPETDVANSIASVVMCGDEEDHVDKKALELNGSELGGRKLVVTVKPYPKLKLRDVPFGGSCVPST